MNKRTLPLSLLLLGFCCALSSANATGTTGAQILEIIPDARTTGMGEAFCAVADDAHCLSYNPAGLGSLTNIEVPLSNNQWLAGASHQSAALVYNLHDVRTTNVRDLGTLAVAMTSLNSGDIISRDAAGVAGAPFRAQDEVLTVAYGRTVYEHHRTGAVLLGASGKFITEEINGEKWYNTAGDLGVLWRTPVAGVSAGIALQNYGASPTYGAAHADLPSNIKIGAACRVLKNAMTLALDVNTPSHADQYVNIGGEYLVARALAFRVGYASRNTLGSGISLGCGLRLSQVDVEFFFAREIAIDYALVPYGDLGTAHRLSVLLKMGAD